MFISPGYYGINTQEEMFQWGNLCRAEYTKGAVRMKYGVWNTTNQHSLPL